MKYINNLILTVMTLNTNLVLRDFMIMTLIWVGIVILALFSLWLFSIFVRQLSLRYPLFLDGYLMIIAKLKQWNKIIRLSKTLSKNYDNLKYIFRNTPKAPFTTIILSRVNVGLGVALVLSDPSFYNAVSSEAIGIIEYWGVEASDFYDRLYFMQDGWSDEGFTVNYPQVLADQFPPYSDGMCNLEENDYYKCTSDLHLRSLDLNDQIVRLRSLDQELAMHYPEKLPSIRENPEVVATWRIAKGRIGAGW